MNKLQLVSAVVFLMALSAQAQNGSPDQVHDLYQCQQDPRIMGAGTELTIDFAQPSNEEAPFTATLIRSATTMPPRSTTETFDSIRDFDDASSRGYLGEGFKLTISDEITNNPQLGPVFQAVLETQDTGPQGQKLFCKQGGAGMPAVTGTN